MKKELTEEQKQGMREACKRWYEKNKDYRSEYNKTYREPRAEEINVKRAAEGRSLKQHRKYVAEFPDKHKAHRIVTNRLKYGVSLQRKPCERCNNEKSEAHHEDYTRPLDVTWLCRSCHARRHREIREEQQKQAA